MIARTPLRVWIGSCVANGLKKREYIIGSVQSPDFFGNLDLG
jgi:hypothetical protein